MVAWERRQRERERREEMMSVFRVSLRAGSTLRSGKKRSLDESEDKGGFDTEKLKRIMKKLRGRFKAAKIKWKGENKEQKQATRAIHENQDNQVCFQSLSASLTT